MQIVVVGGAGLMGRIALRDLVEGQHVTEIVIADLNRQAGEQLIAMIGSDKLRLATVDATDEAALAAVLRGADACLNASPADYARLSRSANALPGSGWIISYYPQTA